MKMSSYVGLVVVHLVGFDHSSMKLVHAADKDADAYQCYKPLQVVLYGCWC